MKIRSGFVSNSSSSSFYLIVIPDNFDPEVYFDYINEKKSKNKKAKFSSGTLTDLKTLVRRGHTGEQDNCHDYYELTNLISPLSVYEGETTEECGYIQIIRKSFFDKIDKIYNEYEINKMKEATIEIRKRREEIKEKTKDIDPYGEEDWDVDESVRIKKFRDI